MANTQLTPRLNRIESNIVIDGGMEIWPEGTSRSVVNNSNLYGAVLFNLENTSSGITLTNSRQSAVPSNTNLIFSNRISKTAAGTLAAGTSIRMGYFVEGYDVSRIYNSDWSVIFWVRSSVASTRSVSIRNASSSHSYVQQYSINSADTWELKVLNFPALSTCPGTIERTTSAGVLIRFVQLVGSTYTTSNLNAWISGNFLAGPGEDTTWLTGTTHSFDIAGVMVMPGDWTALQNYPSMYEFVRAGKNFQEEVAMSERYYEKSYNLNDSPGTPTGNGSLVGVQVLAGGGGLKAEYKVRKRTTPSTVTVYNPATGGAGTVRDYDGSNDAATLENSGETGVIVRADTVTGGEGFIYHFTADARY